MKHLKRCITIGLIGIAALAAGCATVNGIRADGLSLTDIDAMLDARRPQKEIAADIASRGLVAAPTGDQIEALEKRGAGSEVIDAILRASWTPSSSAVATYDPYYGYGYGYGYPYYSGWGSPWPYYGPTFGIGLGWGGYRSYGHGHWRPPGGGIGVRPPSPGPRPIPRPMPRPMPRR